MPLAKFFNSSALFDIPDPAVAFLRACSEFSNPPNLSTASSMQSETRSAASESPSSACLLINSSRATSGRGVRLPLSPPNSILSEIVLPEVSSLLRVILPTSLLSITESRNCMCSSTLFADLLDSRASSMSHLDRFAGTPATMNGIVSSRCW